MQEIDFNSAKWWAECAPAECDVAVCSQFGAVFLTGQDASFNNYRYKMHNSFFVKEIESIYLHNESSWTIIGRRPKEWRSLDDGFPSAGTVVDITLNNDSICVKCVIVHADEKTVLVEQFAGIRGYFNTTSIASMKQHKPPQISELQQFIKDNEHLDEIGLASALYDKGYRLDENASN